MAVLSWINCWLVLYAGLVEGGSRGACNTATSSSRWQYCKFSKCM